MSTIKPKRGHCIDCPPDAPEKFLTAGRCEFHYRAHRNRVNAGKKHNVAKREKKQELNVFFASQILEIPPCCEECTRDIRFYRASKNFARSLVAHILPKREKGGFPLVATHPLNRMFYCPDCHTDFDNKGIEHAMKLKSLPLMISRFNQFKDVLSPQDLERVPVYLFLEIEEKNGKFYLKKDDNKSKI